MVDTINLSKKVVRKEEFSKVVDTSFTTFTSEYINNPLEAPELSVEEFFNEYNKLFFSIPVDGKVNSHEFLISKSGELVNLDITSLQTSLLLEEIDNLRIELVAAYRKIEELQS